MINEMLNKTIDERINERIERYLDVMCRLTPDGREVGALKTLGFFTAPASTKYHGAYEGGLFEHSMNVTSRLVDITKSNQLRWRREESPRIVGMFHDLCKVDDYKRINVYVDDMWEHNDDSLFKGHGEKSVMILSTLMRLTEEEVACIRYHMGAYTDKSEWNDYNRAVKRYPNVLWTHHADMLAAHVAGV